MRPLHIFIALLTMCLLFSNIVTAQETVSPKAVTAEMAANDSTKTSPTIFSGILGVTNNGFSIVPTFSLNAPATNLLFFVSKNKFSIDPDVRFTTDFRKGSILLWFRYKISEGKKFTLRVGAHPAFNFQLRTVTDDLGKTYEITQARRFMAGELVPNYKIKSNWSIGMYFLKGFGLQDDGPKDSYFLTFNTVVSNLMLSRKLSLQLAPAIYYLYLDKADGFYYTGTLTLRHKDVPVILESSFNKIIDTEITGGKNFQWNILAAYVFKKKMVAQVGD